MKELKLVLEVLQRRADGVEAPGLRYRGAFVLNFHPKILDVDEPTLPISLTINLRSYQRRLVPSSAGVLNQAEEVRARDSVDGVADLVMKVPDPLQNCFHLLHLHPPSHGKEEYEERWG